MNNNTFISSELNIIFNSAIKLITVYVYDNFFLQHYFNLSHLNWFTMKSSARIIKKWHPLALISNHPLERDRAHRAFPSVVSCTMFLVEMTALYIISQFTHQTYVSRLEFKDKTVA